MKKKIMVLICIAVISLMATVYATFQLMTNEDEVEKEVVVEEISAIIEHFEDGIKGEIVCMIYAEKDSNTIEIESKIRELKSKGFKDKEIAVILSTLFGVNKNEVYKRSLTL